MSTRRSVRGAVALFVLIGASLPAVVQAAPRAVEFTRAVAYWYMPTSQEDTYRLYHLEIVRLQDLSTGAVSTTGTVVTDKCVKRRLGENVVAFYCGNGRRERESKAVELDVAPDLSAGKAEIQLGGTTHVVFFKAPEDRSMGVFEHDRHCAMTERKFVPGAFSNMERAFGRLLGRRLGEQNSSGYDHAWLERGVGTWCD